MKQSSALSAASAAESVPVGKDSLLAGVQWLCRHHSVTTSLEALYGGLPRDERVKPSVAVRMLEQVGVAAGWVKRAHNELSEYLYPVLLLFTNGDARVLTARRGDRYELVIPEAGGVTISMSGAELQEQYAGYCLLVKPRPAPETRTDIPHHKSEGHWLFSTLWAYRSYYYSAALATCLINVLALASTFFTMNVYDRVVPNQAYVTLWSLAIGVLLAMLFEFTTRQIRAHVLDMAGKKADLVLGAKLFKQLLAVRLEYKPQSAGSFANQFREFESVRDFITSASLATLSDLPFCIVFIGVLFLISGVLALVPLIAVILLLLLCALIQWPLSRYMQENLREASLKHGLLIEAVEGIETLKATHAEGGMQRRWEDFSALVAASSLKTRALSMLATNLVSTVNAVSTVAIVLWGVYLIGDGVLSQGSLIATVMLGSRAIGPLGAAVGLAVRYQQATAALKSLNQLMAMPVEREHTRRYLAAPSGAGQLQLRGIKFAYPAPPMQPNPTVLAGIDLSFNRGERVAIVGNIGSGKSTLLRVVSRLYQPGEGQVMLDGIDASQIDPADWRSTVGFVSQDSRLFFGSLRENVMIGNPGATTDEFVHVARLTGLDAIVANHPLGFDRPVGEMGNALSGGQRQLVALARSLLLRPQVLLLDEPTSGMDMQTERLFLKRLDEASKEQTLIVVTHRFSVLDLVDRLIVLDAGRVAADGPKQQVLNALRNNSETSVSAQKATVA